MLKNAWYMFPNSPLTKITHPAQSNWNILSEMLIIVWGTSVLIAFIVKTISPDLIKLNPSKIQFKM